MSLPHPDTSADLDRILETVGIAVMTIDAAGTLVEANEAAAQMFGHARDAMLGQNVSILMPSHHAVAHDGYLSHHIATGETRIIGRGRKVEGRHKDGSGFPIHLAVGRFELDGEPHFTGIVHDLTESERDHDMANRLGHVVEESLNEIFVFDANTLTYTIVNKSAAANLGYTIEELLGMSPIDIKPEYDRTAFGQLLEPLRIGEIERLRFSTVHERKSGERYDVDIVLQMSHHIDRPEFIAIVDDVTERNQMLRTLRQAHKMKAVGQLSGGVAHDFNNLLTVISGNLELLDMQLEDPDQRELLKEAQNASSMGARLTERLLSFARQSDLAPVTLDLNQHILGLSDFLRRALGEEIVLDLRLGEGLWPVSIDLSLAESAMVNLAINAREAMEGRGRLVVETANATLDRNRAAALDLSMGDYVVLSVADTGSGIPAAAIDKVFDPFFTTKSASGGHGLGLSVIYGFARQSGGHVAVTSGSADGEGARFTLHLPRFSGDASPADDSQSSNATAAQGGKRILMVEDDALVRRLNVRRLERLGHEVLEAEDGPSAIAVFDANETIDVLFTDIMMPNGLSGLDLAHALRRRDPMLPVVIASGYSSESLSSHTLEQYGFVLLHKPYDVAELATAIASVLDSTDT